MKTRSDLKKTFSRFIQKGKLLILLGLSGPAWAQPAQMDLAKSLEMAEHNFPILKQNEYYQQIAKLELENISSRYLPKIQLMGQATYQSDVVQLGFLPPGAEDLELPHERGQVYLNLDQTIYDGGFNSIQRQLQNEQLQQNQKQVEADLHQLKEQVTQLYFALLMSEKRTETLQLTRNTLTKKLEMLQAQLSNGILMESEVLKMETELLKLRQQINKEHNQKQAYLNVFSLLLGQDIGENTEFKTPEIPEEAVNLSKVNRPALQAMSLQKQSLNTQNNMISSQYRPKIAAFIQGGVGYPNPYNFFDNSTSTFYLLGIKANWLLWDWQQGVRQKEILKVRNQIIDTRLQNLERQIQTRLIQLIQDMEQLQQTISEDREIVEMQEEITQLLSAQLDAGVIVSTDFIDQVTARQQAILNLEMHQVQLVQKKVSFWLEKGIIEHKLP